MLVPAYASFIKSSFAISDAHEQGTLSDLTSFELWCKQIAGRIAGREIDPMIGFVDQKEMPEVVKMTFNALLNGLNMKMEKESL